MYVTYKSRDTRAKSEWQGIMNRVQTERWFITEKQFRDVGMAKLKSTETRDELQPPAIPCLSVEFRHWTLRGLLSALGKGIS